MISFWRESPARLLGQPFSEDLGKGACIGDAIGFISISLPHNTVKRIKNPPCVPKMLCFSASELQSGFGASEISAALGLHVNFSPSRSHSRIFRQLLAMVCFFFFPLLANHFCFYHDLSDNSRG